MIKAEEQLLEAEEQYNLMQEKDEATPTSDAFIIIAAVVVVGLIAAMIFMRYMLN